MEVSSNGLTFDEQAHEYHLNGERLLSVSEILEPLFPLNAAPEVIRAAADRGPESMRPPSFTTLA